MLYVMDDVIQMKLLDILEHFWKPERLKSLKYLALSQTFG